MKNKNKVLILVLLIAFATTLTAYAVTVSSPAEIVAKISGKSLDEVTEERFERGQTYGQLAYSEGLWEEFREEMLKNRKALLDEKVANGSLTEEEAKEIYSNMEIRQEYCLERGGGFGMRNHFKQNRNDNYGNDNYGNGFGNYGGFNNRNIVGRGRCRASW
ncbi:MAG: DUF2680 domain-containing protein [Tissierellia bacterium]|nr:DUF2680 domain-containing protein [Tissierellia bacterium]